MEEDYLEQTKGKELDLIVCSDGEAILGIGDQGGVECWGGDVQDVDVFVVSGAPVSSLDD